MLKLTVQNADPEFMHHRKGCSVAAFGKPFLWVVQTPFQEREKKSHKPSTKKGCGYNKILQGILTLKRHTMLMAHKISLALLTH